MATELIFVSYSSKDRPFAINLAKELNSLGANVWIDQLGIKLGENWDNAIENALDSSNTLMLLLSPTSVESQNVQDEVSIAIQENKKLVPILIKECDLPMRWQRRQYADLINNPEKAIGDIVEFLGLESNASSKLKDLLSLIDVDGAPAKSNVSVTPTPQVTNTNEDVLEDQLVSEEEIDRAALMHRRAIKRNWQLIMAVGAISLVLLAVGLLTEVLPFDRWIAVVAGLGLNFLSIGPYGNIKKRTKNIALFDLLKIHRSRLTRVINKLTEKDVLEFNSKFEEYITV